MIIIRIKHGGSAQLNLGQLEVFALHHLMRCTGSHEVSPYALSGPFHPSSLHMPSSVSFCRNVYYRCLLWMSKSWDCRNEHPNFDTAQPCNSGGVQCFPQHRRLRRSVTLPGCSLKVSGRTVVSVRVQRWNSLAWDAVEAGSINAFWNGLALEIVLLIAKNKRQDAASSQKGLKPVLVGSWKGILGEDHFTRSMLFYYLCIIYYQSPVFLKRRQWTR